MGLVGGYRSSRLDFLVAVDGNGFRGGRRCLFVVLRVHRTGLFVVWQGCRRCLFVVEEVDRKLRSVDEWAGRIPQFGDELAGRTLPSVAVMFGRTSFAVVDHKLLFGV